MAPRVLGLDLSITATGVARADGTLETIASRRVGDDRLIDIAFHVEDALLADNPHLVVVEDLPVHAHGAGKTAMAQGVARLLLCQLAIPYVLVTAATLKKYATGNGHATKADMRMALYQRAGLDVRDDNQADAAWLRAAGLDQLGEPWLVMPKSNRAALAKVQWPAPSSVEAAP